ncbi:MAG: Asp-tRNA(Asn)/Glu-tRNA(Gln) amidotransferase subunit GatB [Planctomycetes bacterium]|nr:Asp-tRNA(Asn)/Glu-tRNA(Gln) amidotransferase subunit GatB [Planctomycetota bacterium]
MEYETVIGLETHVQLGTRSKLFCSCPTDFGGEPNSQTCPVCLGLPGVLPVLNGKALEYAVTAGLALGCRIPETTKFDRKHYYYPDLPKNYQISQYDRPVCVGGAVEVETPDGAIRIRITRAHLEEDAGKLVHQGDSPTSGVDLNRTGIPLLEIVSEPDIRSPRNARLYLEAIRQIMRYAGVSECNMEQGSLRCDANISLRPAGAEELGTKVEIKNMNSFAHVEGALAYEEKRQAKALEKGEEIVQETRLYDAEAGTTRSMRTKEYADDYRYFPEPDLPEFHISEEMIKRLKGCVGELPLERKRRYMSEYGLSDYDAGVLTGEKPVAEYFEKIVETGADAKKACNWVTQDILRVLGEKKIAIGELKVRPKGVAELLDLIEAGRVNNTLARNRVFPKMAESGAAASEVIEKEGLAQVSDDAAIEEGCREAIGANPKALEDYRNGKKNAVQFLFGQAMRVLKGKGNPQAVRKALERLLSEEGGGQNAGRG